MLTSVARLVRFGEGKGKVKPHINNTGQSAWAWNETRKEAAVYHLRISERNLLCPTASPLLPLVSRVTTSRSMTNTIVCFLAVTSSTSECTGARNSPT